jgi:hypothetical protein
MAHAVEVLLTGSSLKQPWDRTSELRYRWNLSTWRRQHTATWHYGRSVAEVQGAASASHTGTLGAAGLDTLRGTWHGAT